MKREREYIRPSNCCVWGENADLFALYFVCALSLEPPGGLGEQGKMTFISGVENIRLLLLGRGMGIGEIYVKEAPPLRVSSDLYFIHSFF